MGQELMQMFIMMILIFLRQKSYASVYSLRVRLVYFYWLLSWIRCKFFVGVCDDKIVVVVSYFWVSASTISKAWLQELDVSRNCNQLAKMPWLSFLYVVAIMMHGCKSCFPHYLIFFDIWILIWWEVYFF